jgi:2'-5' RNA ligase superfamily
MQPAPRRRVLVAIVRGALGEQIQTWRERHDARHAARLPPHLTVCYRPPEASLEAIEDQVRHAFTHPIRVRLGSVFYLPHRESPLVVSVHETDQLDAARRRLFDGACVQMGGRDEWPWHITCVRYGYNRDREALLSAAANELVIDAPWVIDRISYLELRDGRYGPVAEWDILDTQAALALPAKHLELDEVGVDARLERM